MCCVWLCSCPWAGVPAHVWLCIYMYVWVHTCAPGCSCDTSVCVCVHKRAGCAGVCVCTGLWGCVRSCVCVLTYSCEGMCI